MLDSSGWIDHSVVMTQAPVAPPRTFQPPPPERPRGPVGGPPQPYSPQVFSSLYLWWAILNGVGAVTSVFLIGIPVLIAAIVLNAVFIYKAWNQIQDGYQRTSAGQAAGFCFIPIFNFYWIFVAYWGLTQDMNAYMRRHGLNARPVNEGLMLALCILIVCSIIPYLGILTAIGALVVSFIAFYQVREAAMQIAAYKADACPGCGYDRTGMSPSAGCPECGLAPGLG